jgi:Est1 DNA/RNA binding domain
MKHDSTPPATTRVYDPRTHIFRSKKAFDSRPGLSLFPNNLNGSTDSHPSIPGVLPAPEGLNTRPYSVPGPGNKRSSLEFESGHQDYQAPGSFLPYDNFNERDPSLLLQPETRPISQEQLVNEVKGIYAGLVMVEKKCVEIDNQQAQNQAEGRTIKLSHEQWQALIALHRTLLHEHHDFFLASQHPSASPALRKLAAKYAMPARMWRHGIHSFLELLRHRLPDSLDHMLAFIYLAYSMMALLKESVPAFEDTWIECLGDLARYRMAIEDEDLRDREVWSGVARYWYNKAADKSPRIGRIQHHLAVLARPNALQQLFYYTRALTCIQPFLNARESILTLFNPILEDHDAVIHRCLPIDIAFIKAHGILFKQGSLSTFDEHTEKFLSLLDNNIGRVTAKWREQGVWIASSNFFGVLSCVGFGTSDTLFVTLSRVLTDTPSRSIELARGIWISLGTGSPQLVQDNRQDTTPQSSEKALVHASYLAFSTLALALQRIGDKNVLPHVHISLVFLFCVSLVPEVMRFVESYVPWALLVAFLNTLGKPGVKYARVEADTFPLPENAYLPEDFAMRGQVWCQQYHPDGFFGEDCPVDDEERSLEMPSMAAARVERCLYLGIRLCAVGSIETEDWPVTNSSPYSSIAG